MSRDYCSDCPFNLTHIDICPSVCIAACFGV